MSESIVIRPIDSTLVSEIELVASRMRETLIEVLGEERGADMYSLDWLAQRVRWHLDPSQVLGQVFLAVNADKHICGHTIVRKDKDDDGARIGLFTTTYVEPASRRHGVAKLLLDQGEAWIREHDLSEAVTYTEKDNIKLQNLYLEHGYKLSPMPKDFVKLAKSLDGSN